MYTNAQTMYLHVHQYVVCYEEGPPLWHYEMTIHIASNQRDILASSVFSVLV